MLYLDYCHIQGVLKNVLTLRMTKKTFIYKKRVNTLLIDINLNICEHDFSITFVSCI